jgi:hypothetical protein
LPIFCLIGHYLSVMSVGSVFPQHSKNKTTKRQHPPPVPPRAHSARKQREPQGKRLSRQASVEDGLPSPRLQNARAALKKTLTCFLPSVLLRCVALRFAWESEKCRGQLVGRNLMRVIWKPCKMLPLSQDSSNALHLRECNEGRESRVLLRGDVRQPLAPLRVQFRRLVWPS